MCLAIPGKVTGLHASTGFRMGRIDFGGISREVCLEFLPEAGIGDFVLVHVGFAMSIVDEAEAARIFKDLEDMDELAELGAAVLEREDEERRI